MWALADPIVAGAPAGPLTRSYTTVVQAITDLWESARRLGAALSRREHDDSWQDPGFIANRF